MCVHNDIGLLRLPENLGQLDGRHALRGNQVTQEIPRPDRWQLVGIANQHQPRPVWQRGQHRLHQRDINHRNLVQNDRVALKRVGQVAGEGCASARAKASFQQPVDGFGLHASQVGQPLGRPAGGCRKQRIQPKHLEHLQNAAHGRRFACARPTGQNDQPVARRGGDCKLLLVRIVYWTIQHKRL